ncbi:MAG: hydantoinase/oxoprolinase family protein [Acidimicrobiia bacterium]
MTLGVDVGGTFTDLVRWDGTRLTVAKISSTPEQADGVVAGSRNLVHEGRVPLLVHGTTVATNALLERNGARVLLVTDPGFEDLIEIARQDRPSLYDPDALRPEPLVPRARRWSTVELEADAEIAAVVLIDSYRDPEAERRLARQVEDTLGVPAVVSTDVSREFREFERMSTTVLTAYLQPVVEQYLRRLQAEVTSIADRLLVMQSSGGLVPVDAAVSDAASILLSGPAGGVVAAAAFGGAVGHDAVISFDMGGTSTDVCRIEGGVPEVAYERSVEGYVCRLPSVAIHTVGAGGGSVGWVDPGGALRVGPRSSGAVPGPASYGRGGVEPTVTDADLLAGRLSPNFPLADGLVLDEAAARRALGTMGRRIGLDVDWVALGMIQIVEAHMERAIRRVSVEEGFDPSTAALVAFGGAGGMHASSLASRLGIGTVLVPPHAGVLSAVGLLLSPPRIDGARTVLLDPSDADTVRTVAADLASTVSDEFRRAVGSAATRVGMVADLRYRGQAHETSVDFHLEESPEELVERFHETHRRRNGFDRAGDPVEVVTLRVSAVGRPAVHLSDLPGHSPKGEAVAGRRSVRTADGETEATVWRRQGLHPGDEVVGPAVVIDGEATTWVEPGARARLHESGTLVIEHG